MTNPNSMILFIGANGPVTVSGNTDVATLNSIMRGHMTLSEILNDTGLKKSTVFSSLKRMNKSGIVNSEGTGNDRRYSVSIAQVFKTCDVDDHSMEPFFDACLTPFTNEFYRNMFLHMIMMGTSNGISLQPMLINYAIMLGDVAYGTIGHPTTDIGLRNLLDYLNATRMADFEIVDMIPLELNVTILPEITPVATSIYLEFISVIISRYVSLCTDNTWVPNTMEHEDGSTYRIILSPTMEKYPYAYGVVPLKSIKMGDVHENRLLSVYRTKNGFLTISDTDQLRVASAIKDRWASVKELSETLSLDEDTVRNAMDALIGYDLISVNKNSSCISYRSKTRPIMQWDGKSATLLEEHRVILKEAFDEPKYFFYYVVSYLILRVASTGADITGGLFSFAGHMADHLLSKMERPTMRKAIELLEQSSFRKIHVGSFIPFTAVTESNHDLESYIAEYFSHFDTMFLGRLMESITNHMHVVTESKIYGDGNRYHRFTIRPSE